MKQNDSDWGTGVLERAKTVKPYTREEMHVLDDGKDFARILATMEQRLRELEEQKEKSD